MSGLSYDQAMWAINGKRGRAPARRMNPSGMGGSKSLAIMWMAQQQQAAAAAAEAEKEAQAKISSLESKIKSKVSSIKSKFDELKALAFRMEGEAASSAGYEIQSAASRVAGMARELGESFNVAKDAYYKVRDLTAEAKTKGGNYATPLVSQWTSVASKVDNIDRDSVAYQDELRSLQQRIKREQDELALAAEKKAQAERDKQAQIDQALAEAQAREVRLAEERAAALAAEQARTQAQLDAEAAERISRQTIELAKIEAELEIERTRLQYDLERLQREEERQEAREEREYQREMLQYGAASQAAQQQYYDPNTQAQIWAPDPGAAEFAFAPGMPAAAPAPRPTYRAPAPAPAPAPQAAPATAPSGGPPPVVVPAAVSPYGPGSAFDASWSAPTGQLFGMGAMVAHRNTNLPADAKVENGYKISGPNAAGIYTVYRPDSAGGGNFPISYAQASKPGVSLADPNTGKVFYFSGSGKSSDEDDGVTVEQAAGLIQAITGAVGTAAGAASQIYSDVTTGGRPPQQQQQQSLAIGGEMPGWVAPLGVIALGILGYSIYQSRQQQSKRRRR